MRTHAIGHQEQMPLCPPLFFLASQQDGVVILVVAAPETDVGQTRVLDVVEPSYHPIPRMPHLHSLSVCYTPTGALQSPWRFCLRATSVFISISRGGGLD